MGSAVADPGLHLPRARPAVSRRARRAGAAGAPCRRSDGCRCSPPDDRGRGRFPLVGTLRRQLRKVVVGGREDRGKRLIELEQVDVAHGEARSLDQGRHNLEGALAHVGALDTYVVEGAELGQGLDAQVHRLAPAGQNERRGAVVDARGVEGGDGPTVPIEEGPRGGELFSGEGARPFVTGDDQRILHDPAHAGVVDGLQGQACALQHRTDDDDLLVLHELLPTSSAGLRRAFQSSPESRERRNGLGFHSSAVLQERDAVVFRG